MRKFPLRKQLLALVACLLLPSLCPASAYNASPKLVVLIILDQFRGDYLERYRPQLSHGGFRLFFDRGAVFTDCTYDYANTRTAPGHATLLTGAYSNAHGIAANEWWDQDSKTLMDSGEDRSTRITGPAGPGGTGASPHHLLADTLGDELKLATAGKSRVFAVSLKDRAAIFSGGFAANGAYWIDRNKGVFITSSFYADKLPAWVNAFDSSQHVEQYWDREWKDAAGKVLRKTSRKLPDGSPDPKAKFYDVVGATPFANDYQLEFTRELIAQEKLGRGPSTDLLIVSFSSLDILGHEVGPDDPQIEAMVLALDRQLGGFFQYLDRQFGLANVWIALSSDHGVAPLPPYAAEKFRLPGASLKQPVVRDAANKELAVRFPQLREPAIARVNWPFAFLSQEAFMAANIAQADAERAVGEVMTRVAGWHRFYTRTQLAEGRVPADEMGRIYAHSYTPYGGWYVLGVPTPFTMGYAPTDHSTAYSYDRHVPLAFYGAPFLPGLYRGKSEPVDLAVTLASLLGINAPTHAMGRVLTEALRDQRSVNPQTSNTGRPQSAQPSQ